MKFEFWLVPPTGKKVSPPVAVNIAMIARIRFPTAVVSNRFHPDNRIISSLIGVKLRTIVDPIMIPANSAIDEAIISRVRDFMAILES